MDVLLKGNELNAMRILETAIAVAVVVLLNLLLEREGGRNPIVLEEAAAENEVVNEVDRQIEAMVATTKAQRREIFHLLQRAL